jgi:hypothetical protein
VLLDAKVLLREHAVVVPPFGIFASRTTTGGRSFAVIVVEIDQIDSEDLSNLFDR